MSRLYASIDADASKTQATRRGHKSITAHVRGWNSGVEVRAYVDENDRDCFEVYRTGGSNGGLAPRIVGRLVAGTRVDETGPNPFLIDPATAAENDGIEAARRGEPEPVQS